MNPSTGSVPSTIKLFCNNRLVLLRKEPITNKFHQLLWNKALTIDIASHKVNELLHDKFYTNFIKLGITLGYIFCTVCYKRKFCSVGPRSRSVRIWRNKFECSTKPFRSFWSNDVIAAWYITSARLAKNCRVMSTKSNLKNIFQFLFLFRYLVIEQWEEQDNTRTSKKVAVGFELRIPTCLWWSQASTIDDR